MVVVTCLYITRHTYSSGEKVIAPPPNFGNVGQNHSKNNSAYARNTLI